MTQPKESLLGQFKKDTAKRLFGLEEDAAVYTNDQKGRGEKPSPSEETLVYPVEGADITSGFGKRWKPREKKKGIFVEEFHRGIDLDGVSRGKPILSMCDGTVRYAKFFKKGEPSWALGKAVSIYREVDGARDGIHVLYGHCDTLRVTKGQKVKRGDVLATVGATGGVTGPHLHLEVRDSNRKAKGTLENPEGNSIHPDKWIGLGLWVRIPGAVVDIRTSVSLPGTSPMLAGVLTGAVNTILGNLRTIQMSQAKRSELAQAAKDNVRRRVASGNVHSADTTSRGDKLAVAPPKRVLDITHLLYENNEF